MNRLWTVRELAKYLNISEARARQRGVPRIAIYGTGGRRPIIRYDPAEVKAWVELRKSRSLLGPRTVSAR
jgi:hypothetical protein